MNIQIAISCWKCVQVWFKCNPSPSIMSHYTVKLWSLHKPTVHTRMHPPQSHTLCTWGVTRWLDPPAQTLIMKQHLPLRRTQPGWYHSYTISMATAEEAATWQKIQGELNVLSPVSVPSGQQWLHQQGLCVPQCNNNDKRHRGFVLPEGVSWETGIEDGDIYLVSARFSTS